MLVLSRKVGEKIYVNDSEIEIKVVGVRGSRVRLAISAPTDVSIRRGELPVKSKNQLFLDSSLSNQLDQVVAQS